MFSTPWASNSSHWCTLPDERACATALVDHVLTTFYEPHPWYLFYPWFALGIVFFVAFLLNLYADHLSDIDLQAE